MFELGYSEDVIPWHNMLGGRIVFMYMVFLDSLYANIVVREILQTNMKKLISLHFVYGIHIKSKSNQLAIVL